MPNLPGLGDVRSIMNAMTKVVLAALIGGGLGFGYSFLMKCAGST
ncbi:MAG TPA: hypothetical protein PLH94_09375 [Fimbriimonadaceae bacterium]|nr:hypothetical protein [Fimbriimonadaceae bacterium]